MYQQAIKKSIVKIIPSFLKRWIVNDFNYYANLSYSMEGEDRVLQRLLGYRETGCFVDVGAHHPMFCSNTFYYYKKAWRGINIDAMPGSMKEFNLLRPRDINIETPISDTEEEVTYYIFNKGDLNTFDNTKLEAFLKFPDVKLIDKIKLKTKTLEQVLNENFSKIGHSHIDFFSVDVEGWDLKVLKSNNWNKYRPDYVLAEDLFLDIVETLNGNLASYMSEQGYKLVAKSSNTVFFKKLVN